MARAILVVEDIPDDALFLERVLKQAGVANPIHVVSDGREAIAYFRGQEPFADRQKFPLPGILFLDLKMPGKGGFDVLDWLEKKPRWSDLVVIVLSGYHAILDVHRAYALGADTYLSKPCTREDIRSLMRSFQEHWIYAPSPQRDQSPS